MTSSPGRVAGTDPWAAYEWVLWRIRVDDPEQRVSEPYHEAGTAFQLPEDSREVMVDFAGRLGCVYEGCWDDGTFGSDDDPYYVWWVRVPQALHARRGASGWPLVVEECQQQLDWMFADHHAWEVLVDGPLTQAFHDGKPLPLMR